MSRRKAVLEVTIKASFGTFYFKAGSYDELVKFLMKKSGGEGKSPEDVFEWRVNEFYKAFKKRFGCHQKRRSPIEKQNMELELARCFLNKMTIIQALGWLETHKKFRSSYSAIGRYWRRFYSLKFNKG